MKRTAILQKYHYSKLKTFSMSYVTLIEILRRSKLTALKTDLAEVETKF
jgi:hypothetical protein